MNINIWDSFNTEELLIHLHPNGGIYFSPGFQSLWGVVSPPQLAMDEEAHSIDSMTPGKFLCNSELSNVQAYFIDWWLGFPAQNLLRMNVTAPY